MTVNDALKAASSQIAPACEISGANPVRVAKALLMSYLGVKIEWIFLNLNRELEDADGYFTYKAVGIRQNVGKPIMIYSEKTQKCKRSEILALNDLRWKDDSFLLKLMSGQDVVRADPNLIRKSTGNDSTPEVVIPQRELE